MSRSSACLDRALELDGSACDLWVALESDWNEGPAALSSWTGRSTGRLSLFSRLWVALEFDWNEGPAVLSSCTGWSTGKFPRLLFLALEGPPPAGTGLMGADPEASPCEDVELKSLVEDLVRPRFCGVSKCDILR